MKWCVYILLSSRDHKLYVGCTTNPEQRLKSHNSGKVRSTKHRTPLVLIHREWFRLKGNAFQRERFLKSLWGAKIKNRILKQYLCRAKPQ